MVSITELYVALLVVAIPILLAALYYVFEDLGRRGSRPLAVILGGSLVWLLSALASTLGPTQAVVEFANKFQYFGITALVTGFAVFALVYTGRERFVNRYSLAVLLIEPVVVLALIWTNHPVWVSGPGFLIHTLYSYVVLGVGALLVVVRAVRVPTIPRGQAVSMGIATFVPTVGNVVSINVLPEGAPDLTPVTFGVMGVALVVGLYRYSLVETDELTGAVDIEGNENGAVLVEDEVVDLNIDAATVLGLDADNAVRTPVSDAFGEHDELRSAHESDPASAAGIELAAPISGERYRVSVSKVAPEGATRTGWLYEFSPEQ